jgi:threonine/homoserine efflux transporter RhtA
VSMPITSTIGLGGILDGHVCFVIGFAAAKLRREPANAEKSSARIRVGAEIFFLLSRPWERYMEQGSWLVP